MFHRILGTCFAVLCAGAAAAGEDVPRSAPQEPFFRLREHRAEYAGPGRHDAPGPLDEVLLGYFGPSDAAHPEAGDLWCAAELAVEEANRRGGYRGKPFRVLARWSENPWGSGVGEVVRMVYREKVWAIVGGIDGPSTHLVEQVAVKARIPLLSPASTDKTVNLANVPWMFSLVPGDHLQTPVVAEAIGRRVGDGRLVLLSGVGHDSALFARELRKALAARDVLLSYHVQCRGTEEEAVQAVGRAVESRPEAVAVIAGPQQGARLVAALREQGFRGPVFGGPATGRRRFLEEAGARGEGVLFPLVYDPDRPGDDGASRRFAETFQRRHGHAPDYAAAHTYDAFRLVIAAIRSAGLNRARIRDAIRKLSPYPGVTGPIRWDPLGSNTRPVSLGTIREGGVVPAK